MHPVDRADATARYAELPLPDTTQEAWRFTDLTGFDPDAFGSNGHGPGTVPRTMLDIDVSGLAHVSERGLEIERAPEGVTFEPLGEDPRLGTLVGSAERGVLRRERLPTGLGQARGVRCVQHAKRGCRGAPP